MFHSDGDRCSQGVVLIHFSSHHKKDIVWMHQVVSSLHNIPLSSNYSTVDSQQPASEQQPVEEERGICCDGLAAGRGEHGVVRHLLTSSTPIIERLI